MMRWVGWALLAFILTSVLVAGNSSGLEAEMTAESVNDPGSGAVLPGDDVNVTVYLHDGGAPVEGEAALFVMFPDGSYYPDGMPIPSGPDGWYNFTLTVDSPYAGKYTYSICDPDVQDGWGGGEGFFLDSTGIVLLGVATDSQYYSPGGTVWYSVINDEVVTNVSDVGGLRLFNDSDDAVLRIGRHSSGGFELPLNLTSGFYTIRTEEGGLEGGFAISDIELHPRKDIYHFGETITLHTSIEEGMDVNLISPSGSVIQFALSGTTEIKLPGPGDAGYYTFLVFLEGSTLFRERVHLSQCDLWADTEVAVHQPGEQVRVHFSARDIGTGLGGFESLNWDLVYHTPDGVQRESHTLQQTSGVISFTPGKDVSFGEALWNEGKDNRVELYLNVSSHQVRRTVPLVFGSGMMSIEGSSLLGENETMDLDILTRTAGTRPIWNLRTPGGDVRMYDRPHPAGTDPFGRALMRSGDLVHITGSLDHTTEEVWTPMPGIDMTITVNGSSTELTTDHAGSAVFRTGPFQEGTYYLSVEDREGLLPGQVHVVRVSGEALEMGFIGPDMAFAGEEVVYRVIVTSGGETVDVDVDHTVEFGEVLLLSGHGDISFTMPDAEGIVTLTGWAVVNGILVRDVLEVTSITGKVHLALEGGTVAPGSTFSVVYALLNVSGTVEISYLVEGIESGELTAARGNISIDVPADWTGREVTVSIGAYDPGRVLEAEIDIPIAGTMDLDVPADPLEGDITIGYSSTSPGTGGVFIAGTYTVLDDAGTAITGGALESGSGDVVLHLEGGTYAFRFSVMYLTANGIEMVDGVSSVHVKAPPTEEEEEGVDVYMYMVLVLLLVVIGLAIGLAGSQRKIREMKARARKDGRRIERLRRKFKNLKDMLPSEEGHTVIKREDVPDEEAVEEPEEDEVVADSSTLKGKPIEDDKTWATEAPCPMCGELVYVPAKRPSTIRCAKCSFEFIVE